MQRALLAAGRSVYRLVRALLYPWLRLLERFGRNYPPLSRIHLTCLVYRPALNYLGYPHVLAFL